MPVHCRMLRHSCGYKLANDGIDTRAIRTGLATSRSPIPPDTPRSALSASATSGRTKLAVLDWNIVSRYVSGMEKGLSPFQKDILAALEEWPSLGQQPAGGDLSTWARPRDILRALGRPSTPATRVGVMKALARLCERGVVAVASGRLASAAKSRFYVRIAN